MRKIIQTHLLALFALQLYAPVLHAAVITVNPGAPMPGADWIYSASFGAPKNGSTDFTDNNPPPGQSFTTSGTASGYLLNAITVKGVADNGEFDNTFYRFHIDIGSISGSSFTSLQSEQALISKTVLTNNTASYVTFNLDTPLSLAASSSYAYRIYVVKPAEDNSYFGFAKSTTNLYTGGAALNSNGSTLTYQAAGTDFTFYADVTAVPEPSIGMAFVLGGVCLMAARRTRRRGLD